MGEQLAALEDQIRALERQLLAWHRASALSRRLATIPGFGPPVTFSAVPRDWAVGLTLLPWGGDLYVSRGIGMERFDAPRVRFDCRPELAILDLVP